MTRTDHFARGCAGPPQSWGETIFPWNTSPGPGSATRDDIETLTSVGLSSHAIVSLSQLISYVNFQSRVLAGLRALKGAA